MANSTKYAIILFDGMADHPDGNGETPMSLAVKPTTDRLAAHAEVGLCHTVPQGFTPGSDVANLSVMGYDPKLYYTGRSPLEAISMGVPLNDNGVTYRCNLVTLSGEENYRDKTMLDYSGGDVSTPEAHALMECIDKNLSGNGLKFYAGVAYRHCLLRQNGTTGAYLTPPHDISDRRIAPYLPQGEYADRLLDLMQRSYELLTNHPVNIERVKRGLKPANSVWLWGEGTKPKLQNFKELNGISGAVISAVDLIKGIAICAGMRSIDVTGATGNLNTNFAGKAQAAIDALKQNDLVYIHLEAPDECGHQGDKQGKIRAIELIDEQVVRPVYAALSGSSHPFKILVMPDHATPVELKTHTSEPIPYLIYDSGQQKSGVSRFTEKSAASTGIRTDYAYNLIKKLIF